MNFFKKNVIYILLILLLVTLFFVVITNSKIKNILNKNTEINTIIDSNVNKIDSTFIYTKYIDIRLVEEDIKIIGEKIGLSNKQIKLLVNSVDSASNKYKVPVLLLHSIIIVESEYDLSAFHSPIIVKGKQTRAIGLAGIVWEYHSDNLIKEGISSTRLELVDPRVNIMASAFIINMYLKNIFMSNPNITEDKLFDELIRRYYGAYDESYKNKMINSIKNTSSRYWVKRIIREVFYEYKVK
jgi:hypothetical protein